MTMHLILEPLVAASTAAIEIHEHPFPIGRNEPPFNQMPRTLREQLSRQHASLFEQQGRIYLQDLGSTNGTYLNAQTLDRRPQAIEDGDRIQFGNSDALCFRAVLRPIADAEDETELLAVIPPSDVADTSGTLTSSEAITSRDVYSDDASMDASVPAAPRPVKTAASTPGASPGKPTSGFGRWLLAALILLAIATGLYLFSAVQPGGLRSISKPGEAEALSQLNRRMNAALQQDDIEGADRALAAYQQKHGARSEVQALQADLASYKNLLIVARENQQLNLAIALKANPLSTALFQQHVARRFASGLPPDALIDRYIAADQAWRNGELIEAITIARSLSNEPWGEYAEQRLSHYDDVISSSEELQSMRGSEGYYQQLLEFYRRLDPDRDQFFHRQLAQELERIGKQAP